MTVTWKEVKTRKPHICGCCSTAIPQGTQCFTVSFWLGDNPKTSYYCVFCGSLHREGKSYEEILQTKANLNKKALVAPRLEHKD